MMHIEYKVFYIDVVCSIENISCTKKSCYFLLFFKIQQMEANVIVIKYTSAIYWSYYALLSQNHRW